MGLRYVVTANMALLEILFGIMNIRKWHYFCLHAAWQLHSNTNPGDAHPLQGMP